MLLSDNEILIFYEAANNLYSVYSITGYYTFNIRAYSAWVLCFEPGCHFQLVQRKMH